MRASKYLILFLLFCNNVSGQDITGLWKGTLYNDTTKQFYRYEVAISEEKGKLTGYSHTWFILDDKQYYGVKKVKIKKEKDKIIVEDDDLIANNYPVPPAKNVRQLNVLTLETKEQLLLLTGPFTTNRTKQFQALTGTINLQRNNDFWQSALIPHLQELGKSEQLSFVKDEKNKLAKQKTKETDEQKAEEEKQANIAKAITQKAEADKLAVKQAAEKQAVLEKEQAKINAAALAKEKKDKEAADLEIAKLEKAAAEATAKENDRKAKELIAIKEAEKKATAEQIAKNEADRKAKELLALKESQRKQAEILAAKQKADKLAADAIARKEAERKEIETQKAMLATAEANKIKAAAVQKAADSLKAVAVTTPKPKNTTVINTELPPVNSGIAAVNVNTRTTELQQTVYFKSDSLQLTLFDNGEVDGDTVSVLMNGVIIFAKERLSTNAVRKMVAIDPSQDSVQLIMYAENLGTIAPNTGLLVVKDGRDIYEVRFNGNLQKNAAIVFRRRR